MALDKIKTDVITDDAITVAKMNTDTGVQPEHHKVPVYANNSARDSAIGSPANGMIIYNTAESALQQYNGTWSTIAPAPTISSLSGTINEDTNTTLTVNGSQYVSGMTIKLVLASDGSDVSGHTSLSYTLVSSAQITVTVPTATTSIAPGTAVQLEIIKSGLSVKSQSLTVSEDPNWNTSAGTIQTIPDLLGTNQTVATLAATAGAGGGTIVYSIDDSGSPQFTTGFVLNTSTGVITTHASTALTTLTGSGDYTEAFNGVASISGDSTKATTRAFNIIVSKSPTTTGEDPFQITISNTRYLVYPFRVMQAGTSTALLQYTPAMTTSDKTEAKLFGDGANDTYTFTLHTNTNVEVVMIGGGGGSSTHHAGGCGAGGALDTAGTPVAWTSGTFTVTVGTGGANSTGWNTSGSNGGDSTIAEGTGGLNSSHTSIIAKGGGSGNFISGGNAGSTPPNGGCAGGGSYQSGKVGGTSNQATFTGYTKYGTSGGATGITGGDYGMASGGGIAVAGASWNTATNSAPGGNGRSTIFGLSQSDSNSIMAGTGVGENKLQGTNYYYGGGGGGSTYNGVDFQCGVGGLGGGGKGLDTGTGWESLWASGHNSNNDIQTNWSGGQAHTGGGAGGFDRVNTNASDGALSPWGGSGFVLIKVPA